MKRPILSKAKAQEWLDRNPQWSSFRIKVGKTGMNAFSVIDGYGSRDTKKHATGCGWDKLGGCIGYIIEQEMYPELCALMKKVGARRMVKGQRRGLYGAHVWNNKTNKRQTFYTGDHCEIMVDGGTGINTMETTLNLLGFTLTRLSAGNWEWNCYIEPLKQRRDWVFDREHWS